jgi:hypothetical protein
LNSALIHCPSAFCIAASPGAFQNTVTLESAADICSRFHEAG